MIDQQRVAKFLASGLKPAQVASIVGCTPGYISQLEKDESFQALVEELRGEVSAEPQTEEKLLDNKYLATEHRLLTELEQKLPHAEVRDVIAAIRVIGDRQEAREKRKAIARIPQGLGGAPGATATLTILTLPVHAIPEYQVNAQRQITAIGDRAMSPLSSEGVKALFSQMKALAEPSEIYEGGLIEG